MVRFIFLFIWILLTACDTSVVDDYYEHVSASVMIDSTAYDGTAYIYPVQRGDIIHHLIILSFDDSTNIEIESRKFSQGTFSMSSYNGITFDMMINGKRYSPKEGVLSIEHPLSGHIVGEFDIVVFDASSKCSNCPEDLIHTVGKFNAVEVYGY